MHKLGDVDALIGAIRVTLPIRLRDWAEQQVSTGRFRDTVAYVLALIDADMGVSRTQGQSRSEWVTAQVKSRNHASADDYIRHLIERDMQSVSPRASRPLTDLEADMLGQLLYIRGVVEDIQRRLAREAPSEAGE